MGDTLFWKKVNKNGPRKPNMRSRCWIWTGYIDHSSGGYGIVGRQGKRYKAHRWAWFLAEGSFPADNALHRCDTPACVRRSHLFEGTQQENIIDMARKGRHGMSTLTNNQVAEIRKRAASGEKITHLAREFDVRHPCVSRIVSGARRA